jgi:tripartite-type tricarboxylate transporter receptor subunit TctC
MGIMRHMTACLALACGLAVPTLAQAETAADFYRGKTITIIVGTGANSGAVEGYPRAIMQVIRKYIPGNPNIVLQNMPGAGGIKAANYIYNIAPQDGTVWGFITRGFVLAAILKIPQAEFDPTKFNWIGSPARSVSVGEYWTKATAARTIQDAMKREIVVGATSAGQDTGVFPAMLNRFAGTKFRIVTGYKSSGEIDLAMERGEAQGKMGVTWTSLNSGRTVNWVSDKLVTIVVQFGLQPTPGVPSEAPVALDLAKTPDDRQAMEVLCAPTALGYPSFMGPGVPADRIALMREAYTKTMKDPEFLAAAERQSLDVDPIGSDELASIVTHAAGLPQAAIKRAREVLPNG